jgi:hypothetical protein
MRYRTTRRTVAGVLFGDTRSLSLPVLTRSTIAAPVISDVGLLLDDWVRKTIRFDRRLLLETTSETSANVSSDFHPEPVPLKTCPDGPAV